MSRLSITNCISQLTQGLETQNIDFVLSEAALGCNITEVYVTEADELILFPKNQLDIESLQWILRVRTPLRVRITIFSSEVSALKIRLLSAINRLKRDGLVISQTEDAISVQELKEKNIKRLIDSFEKWAGVKSDRNGHAQIETSSYRPNKEQTDSLEQKQEDLYVHLRFAIKTYWTERYFARYMNIPSQKVKELGKRIGIQQEVCGTDTLYFFDRKRALKTYFEHIIKGILDELKMKYQKTSKHDFYLPDLHLTLHFFDGTKERLKILADEFAQNHDLIVIVPETLRRNIGRIQDDFFQVLPLNQDKIKSALIRVIRQRINYIPAYSSGIIN
jgi:hypothetical protein